MSLIVGPDIASLVPYTPGKPLEELEREYGITDAVKLASNENALGPSPRAQAAIKNVVDTLNRYPDGGAHYLRRALAARWNVSSGQLIIGNGSDEIIGLLAKTFLDPGQEAVMADHTFVMYRLAVKACHGVPIEVPLKNWRYDLTAMVQAVTDRTRLLFLCNPNNPTGTIVSREEVEALLSSLPRQVVVVFDEAYYEYVRDTHYPDSLQYVKQHRPVIVLRTFSKIYGLAGLRVGYGISTPEIINFLNRVRPPFNANSIAQRAALAALEDTAHVEKSRAMNEEEMGTLEKGLQTLGCTPIPSQANFLYFDCGRDGAQVFEGLLREGVIVRHIKGSMVRVTVGKSNENQRFLQALARVLRQPFSSESAST